MYFKCTYNVFQYISIYLEAFECTIGHLTNYGQNTYFLTFWTFSHVGKSRNDMKPVSAGRQ
jgi:hypothetical protein